MKSGITRKPRASGNVTHVIDNIFNKRGTWHQLPYVDESAAGPLRFMVQDADGFIWLVYGNGRSFRRYDGNRLVQKDVGLPEGFDPARCITLLDGRIVIWNESGMVVFDGYAVKPLSLPAGMTKILRVLRKPDGVLLILTETDLYTFADGSFSHLANRAEHEPLKKDVSCMQIDSKGKVWVSTENRLWLFDAKKSEPLSPLLSDGKSFWGFVLDDEDHAWLDWNGRGVLQFDGDKFQVLGEEDGFPKGDIVPRMADDLGNIWMSVRPGGLLCVTGRGNALFTVRDGLPVTRVTHNFVDRCGRFWMYSQSGGMCYDPFTLATFSLDGAFRAADGNADGEVCWVGARSVFYHDGKEQREIVENERENYSILRRRNGDIWVGGASSLSSYTLDDQDSSRNVSISLAGSPLAFCEDVDERLWFGTNRQGLGILENKEPKWIPCKGENYSDARITAVHVDPSGQLWAGRDQVNPGIYRLVNEEYLERLDSGEAFVDSTAPTCFLTDSRGRLWSGGEDTLVFMENGQVHIYGSEEGFTGGHIVDLAEDAAGRIWISTLNNGLLVTDGTYFQVLNHGHGLPSDWVVKSIPQNDGSIIIFTSHGLCRYMPEDRTPPVFYIEGIEADGVVVEGNNVQLPETSSMMIKVGAVSHKPGDPRYFYQLDGVDETVFSTKNDSVHYGPLEPGKYKLKIRALDVDLMMSDEVSVDITVVAVESEVKKLASELHNAQDFASNIIRSMHDAILVTDLEGTVVSANYAAANLLGTNRDDLIQRSVHELLAEKYAGLLDPQGIQRLMKEQVLKSTEALLRSSSGKEVPVLLSASCMTDRKGYVQGLVVVVSDMTDYKQVQSQLLWSQKMESIGVLAGGIAHDFNNLLGMMIGNADLALAALPPDAEVREELNDIMTAGHRAAELCKEMLAYSGKGKLLIKKIRLTELVKRNMGLLKASLSGCPELTYDLASDLPYIEGDEAQISQILVNLVTNAVEALGDGHGSLTVTTGIKAMTESELLSPYFDETPSDGDYVFLEVADTGCGMSKEIQEKIFEPFSTTKFLGRGLGLAAVHGILRGHGGAIKIRSKEGEGTTVTVFLPAAMQQPSVPVQEVAPQVPVAQGRILIVDDEVTLQAMLKHMVTTMGYGVFVADNGEAAVNIVSEKADDVFMVLLDMTMPGMDGKEAYDRIKEIRPDMPIIIVSGYSQTQINERFGDTSIPFLQKPFTFSQLQKAINAICVDGLGIRGEAK